MVWVVIPPCNNIESKHACKHQASLPRVKKEFHLDSWVPSGLTYAGVSNVGGYKRNTLNDSSCLLQAHCHLNTEEKLSVSWQLFETYGVINGCSGWRKDVINQCLESGTSALQNLTLSADASAVILSLTQAQPLRRSTSLIIAFMQHAVTEHVWFTQRYIPKVNTTHLNMIFAWLHKVLYSDRYENRRYTVHTKTFFFPVQYMYGQRSLSENVA